MQNMKKRGKTTKQMCMITLYGDRFGEENVKKKYSTNTSNDLIFTPFFLLQSLP